MAENIVTNNGVKAIPVEVTEKAKGKVIHALSMVYDLRCALEKLEEAFASKEEYGWEVILRSLSGEMGQAAEELEDAERLLMPESTEPTTPNTPPEEIADSTTIERVKEVLAAKGQEADKLKGSVELLHHFTLLDKKQPQASSEIR
ncbi:conserved protein of unknown function [Pseudodesulfovibrio profundus]|uniref:Uncharacterized protein n=1 Tax=Pseudodesulfovibrio profundus TaxID=57320 RepID=A0A2C8FB35_9BACT|nr:hypothetical protein [Pseudodesulfovibrio profundus]SOB59647.1 conserved protein of unknown function [Pseudodesulfovibrio profundus]